MKKMLIIILFASFMLAGCTQTGQIEAPAQEVVETPTPTPTPTETPTPEPTPAEEETESSGDPLEDLTRKIKGVWGSNNDFEMYDGTTITRGWFGSDILPDAKIGKVTELAPNKYEVYVEDDAVIDDEEAGFEYHGEDYTVIIDGSYDDFKTVYIASYENSDRLYIRVGETIEEGEDYTLFGSFRDDYRKLNYELLGVKDLGELASGVWYTEGYDEFNNWNSSYKLDLGRDGTASCTGYRNMDTGTYEITGENTALITFDHCEIDSPGEGWVPVEGFVYTVEMKIDGENAEIKIDAPDVISNLGNGKIFRKIKYK